MSIYIDILFFIFINNADLPSDQSCLALFWAGYQKSKANSKFCSSEKSRAYQPKSMTCLASFDSDDMPTVQVCVSEDRRVIIFK